MKDIYEELQIETIVFLAQDVITESPYEEDPSHKNGGDEHDL